MDASPIPVSMKNDSALVLVPLRCKTAENTMVETKLRGLGPLCAFLGRVRLGFSVEATLFGPSRRSLQGVPIEKRRPGSQYQRVSPRVFTSKAHLPSHSRDRLCHGKVGPESRICFKVETVTQTERASPTERTKFLHLPVTPTEWLPPSHRRAFTGSC
jgi:hypothetical protein